MSNEIGGTDIARRIPMKRTARAMAIALVAGLGFGEVSTAKSPKSPLDKEAACGEFGTSVHFEDTPADAAKQAKKDEKLVMILHVSGHFEDPRFT